MESHGKFIQNIKSEKKSDLTDKDAYVKKLHAKLDEWNAEIDKLKAKADKAEADSRAEYQKQVENLRDKREDAKKSLNKYVRPEKAPGKT